MKISHCEIILLVHNHIQSLGDLFVGLKEGLTINLLWK